MFYARAHDQTVEADYFAAMERIEQRLQVAPQAEAKEAPVSEAQKEQILALAEQLAVPEAPPEQRSSLFAQIRSLLLDGEALALPVQEQAWIPPPVVPAAV